VRAKYLLFAKTLAINNAKDNFMPRIAGIDIPEKKKTIIALTYVYGVGPHAAAEIVEKAKIDPDKRAKDLTGEEIAKIQRVLERYNVEGALRKLIRDNIDRLKRIGSYRGSRHIAGLPSRGQRTRVNARTRRGRRLTVGAMKKEDLAKVEAAKK
jgi:small subunit ribosomal protein S13